MPVAIEKIAGTDAGRFVAVEIQDSTISNVHLTLRIPLAHQMAVQRCAGFHKVVTQQLIIKGSRPKSSS